MAYPCRTSQLNPRIETTTIRYDALQVFAFKMKEGILSTNINDIRYCSKRGTICLAVMVGSMLGSARDRTVPLSSPFGLHRFLAYFCQPKFLLLLGI